MFRNKKELNRFTLTGKKISITYFEEYVILTIEIPGNALIPIFIPAIKNCQYLDNLEYVEVQGFINATENEVNPHKFEYRLEAENIYPANSDTQINNFEGFAYLAQPPKILHDLHPYTATLYLGTGSFFENDIFLGNRFKFNLILLRKNIKVNPFTASPINLTLLSFQVPNGFTSLIYSSAKIIPPV